MRKRRELRDGACYHVSARANDKKMILVDGRIKELFLDVVKRAKRKFDFQVENFCIMGNHVHMIIRPGKHECLSSIMQWILGVFAMAYNRLCGTSGHIWGERFFSRIIRSLREFMLIFTYIDENPVSACQVDDRRDWPWGGLRHARTGCRDVLSGSTGYAHLLFPEHSVLLLPRKG